MALKVIGAGFGPPVAAVGMIRGAMKLVPCLGLLVLCACDRGTGVHPRADAENRDAGERASCAASTVAELRACIDALAGGGGTVALAAGDYLLSEHVQIPHSGIHLRGAGVGRTRIAIADGACQAGFVVGSAALHFDEVGPVEDVSIHDLSIDGNKTGNACCETYVAIGLRHLYVNGISVFGARDVSIMNVSIRNARSGGIVADRGVRELVIANVVIQSSAWDGVALYQTRDSRVQDSVFEQNAAAGISLDWYADGNVFSGNLLLRNGAGEHALDTTHCPDVMLARESPGIFSAGCSENAFVGNVITGSGGNGVQLGLGSDKHTGSSRNYLGRNVIRQSGEFGVWLVGNASRENVAVGMVYSGNRLGSLLRTATTLPDAQLYLDIAAQTDAR
jgi:hypothetical protein